MRGGDGGGRVILGSELAEDAEFHRRDRQGAMIAEEPAGAGPFDPCRAQRGPPVLDIAALCDHGPMAISAIKPGVLSLLPRPQYRRFS
jgi:hypothetical protein